MSTKRKEVCYVPNLKHSKHVWLTSFISFRWNLCIVSNVSFKTSPLILKLSHFLHSGCQLLSMFSNLPYIHPWKAQLFRQFKNLHFPQVMYSTMWHATFDLALAIMSSTASVGHSLVVCTLTAWLCVPQGFAECEWSVIFPCVNSILYEKHFQIRKDSVIKSVCVC